MFKWTVEKISTYIHLSVSHVTPEDWKTIDMPDGLTHLFITGDFLDELVVPEGVIMVNVPKLSLRSITLPESVTWLSCRKNCLRELALPGGIEYVDAHKNLLTRLEFRSPPTELGNLIVSHNNLSTLNFEATPNLYGVDISINENFKFENLTPSLREFLRTHE